MSEYAPSHAVEISDGSWILYNTNEEPCKLVIRRVDRYSFIDEDGETEAGTLEQLYYAVGGAFKFKDRPTKNTTKAIGDFPVDTDDIYNIVEINGDVLPSFTKSEKSQVKFAAGYYGLKFSTSYVGVWCPKVSTLEKYTYLGPFTDRFIMQNEVRQANKELENEAENSD